MSMNIMPTVNAYMCLCFTSVYKVACKNWIVYQNSREEVSEVIYLFYQL